MDNESHPTSDIRESLLLEDLPQDTIAELMAAAEKVVVPAQTVICRQGDPGDKYYIINSGKVKVFITDESGRETEFKEMGPGQGFGEMALLTGQPRSATVEALEETRLTVIYKSKFDQILRDHPQVSVKFIHQMSAWLQQHEHELQEEQRILTERPHMSWIDFVVIIGISLAFALFFNSSNPNGIKLFPETRFFEEIKKIAPASEIAGSDTEAYLLLDARPQVFFDEQHIQGALSMPYAMFDIMYMMYSEKIGSAEKIVVTGRTISKLYDELTARKLILNGHENVYILDGGLRAWKKKGLPIEP